MLYRNNKLCKGQANDGAANMSGHLGEIATHFKAEEPAALHAHCLAHSLNLCLQDVSCMCSYIHGSLEIVKEIVKVMVYSRARTPSGFIFAS